MPRCEPPLKRYRSGSINGDNIEIDRDVPSSAPEDTCDVENPFLYEGSSGDLTNLFSPTPSELVDYPVEWIQCTHCQKWRVIAWWVDGSKLPKSWTCKQNEWEPATASCDIPEDIWSRQTHLAMENDSDIESTENATIIDESSLAPFVSSLPPSSHLPLFCGTTENARSYRQSTDSDGNSTGIDSSSRGNRDRASPSRQRSSTAPSRSDHRLAYDYLMCSSPMLPLNQSSADLLLLPNLLGMLGEDSSGNSYTGSMSSRTTVGSVSTSALVDLNGDTSGASNASSNAGSHGHSPLTLTPLASCGDGLAGFASDAASDIETDHEQSAQSRGRHSTNITMGSLKGASSSARFGTHGYDAGGYSATRQPQLSTALQEPSPLGGIQEYVAEARCNGKGDDGPSGLDSALCSDDEDSVRAWASGIEGPDSATYCTRRSAALDPFTIDAADQSSSHLESDDELPPEPKRRLHRTGRGRGRGGVHNGGGRSRGRKSSVEHNHDMYVVESIISHEFKSAPRKPRYTNVLVKWEGYAEPSWHGATAFKHLAQFKTYASSHADFARVFARPR